MPRTAFAICLASILLLGSVLSVSAQPYPHCRPGETPRFTGAIALKALLGDTMGEPLECEHLDVATGARVQATTRGLAVTRGLGAAVTFTDGYRYWALVGNEVLSWLALDSPPARVWEAEAIARVQSAIDSQWTTRLTLRVLGDAFTCPEARLVSYRVSDAEPEIADQWYVASQVWADALLARLLAPVPRLSGAERPAWPATRQPPEGWNAPDAHCHLDKAFIFLDRLWDYELGGYYPRAHPTALWVSRETRYTDDNSLAGLAFLERLTTVTDDLPRRQYLHAAHRQAAFLMQSGVWDGTFGGGFWWNTERGTTIEGKPAQSNALAALFFARLYQATGVEAYRDWALNTLLWLDTFLYNPARQLYRYSIHYESFAPGGAPVIVDRYFNYDQAIAIEAQLAAYQLDGDPARLERARAVGRAIHPAFWGEERGGYNLEAGIEQVFTSYGAWTSLGHLALYDLDRDAHWLELARANTDALMAALRAADGGYGFRHYRCVDQFAPGCETGLVPWVVDRTRDTTAQAWMQHLNTALAERLLARAAVVP